MSALNVYKANGQNLKILHDQSNHLKFIKFISNKYCRIASSSATIGCGRNSKMSEVEVPDSQPKLAVSLGTTTPTNNKVLYQKGTVPPEAKKVIKDNMKQVLNKLG